MVATAVKITLVPEQIVLSESLEVIETLGTKTVLTIVVIAELVAVRGEAQTEFELKTQVTTSLFNNPVVE